MSTTTTPPVNLDILIEQNGLKVEFFPDVLQQRVTAWQQAAKALNEAGPEARRILDKPLQLSVVPIWASIQEYYESGAYETARKQRMMLRLKMQAAKVKLELMSYDAAQLGGVQQSSSEKFSTVEYMPREEIILMPALFQGRSTAFSQETVDKIVREGFDKSQDPIIVWYHPQKHKYAVISGHSRWEGSEILFKRGDTSLAKMPVKRFLGDEEAAVNYAVLESNRSGTAEGLKSDLRAYKRAAEQGYNRAALLSLFKPESYLRVLQDLANLNEAGRFLEHLGEDSETSYPFLRRNAQWVGTLRKMYPAIQHSHEREMFQYLYKDKSRTGTKKEAFFDLISKKVTKFDFDKTQPLNLENVVYTSALTDPFKEQIRDLDEQISFNVKERERKENNLIRARGEKNEKLVAKFQTDISQISQFVLKLLEQKATLEQRMRTVERGTSFDLFSLPPAPAPVAEPPAALAPDKLAALRLKAQMLKIKLELLEL